MFTISERLNPLRVIPKSKPKNVNRHPKKIISRPVAKKK
jgi:hypothetical protein